MEAFSQTSRTKPMTCHLETGNSGHFVFGEKNSKFMLVHFSLSFEAVVYSLCLYHLTDLSIYFILSKSNHSFLTFSWPTKTLEKSNSLS